MQLMMFRARLERVYESSDTKHIHLRFSDRDWAGSIEGEATLVMSLENLDALYKAIEPFLNEAVRTNVDGHDI